MPLQNQYSVRSTLEVGGKSYTYYSLQGLEEKGHGAISKLPVSIKVLLEGAVRQFDGRGITADHVKQLMSWAEKREDKEIPFIPSRIVLQDLTGVPVVVDLAAMRETVKKAGGDPKKINPLVPVDLVIDHSVMVDAFGSPDALEINQKIEFERNAERYKFFRWAQTAFDNFRAVPPDTGIVHQVNLEYLASVATTKVIDGETVVFPDSLVGTDSHTTMINGLGIVGWGVGGIEAEAGMLGQPLYFVAPEVIGFKLTGMLAEGATATDLALTVTEILRKRGVVGKFVEFFGDGLSNISLPDRATVANMAPEYGATVGFFPVDAITLNFLRQTGRTEEQIELVEAYYKAQGMFRTDDTPDPTFTDVIELDLSTIVPSLAGPKRPQDRIELTAMKEAWSNTVRTPVDKGGYGLSDAKIEEIVEVKHNNGKVSRMGTGAVVLAAITSCTNTSNPSVMLGAGLVAKKAVEKGLVKPEYVKSSLTPGSLVVTDYLTKSGLLPYLEKLGFYVAGYGCATCIGNSGPLPDEISQAIADNDMTVAAVLSGNRNFEGRIHAQIKANYLASPPLVVAYALAGTVDIDFANDPIGHDQQGEPVYLRDIWPSSEEIANAASSAITPQMFRDKYDNVYTHNERWNQIPVPQGELYEWDENSTYIANPPFFDSLADGIRDVEDIKHAKTLLLLGDSVTTDHISPAGSIRADYPGGKYLIEHGVEKKDFNSYGSRRGHHEVMVRGTFANIRIRNQVAPGTEGSYTTYLPTDEVTSVYEGSMKYQADKTNLIVIGGKEYGTGSSRDWAAKGTFLLGVKAVITESFERIHRANLVGMGVLPLCFQDGQGWKTLGITGRETFDIEGLSNDVKPGDKVTVVATREDGSTFQFQVTVRLDSLVEVDYYRNGGILQTVLRQMLSEQK
ncbi:MULTISPECIES: aconitate hydratase AcnA [unclassified Paenibacillus]|uniref:aconitate hydratase AcnA n=1 Tax=unclassified Paenibacillus TaxID=185978 RepID=UPI00095702DD|nr:MULTISPECIES: aconitate hydratase AcnA [unclassified Paenibacillus]ASS68581.1 aconitate hydratase AcnA [Paenibacillus sp. RUD330]SIR63943.1 aconitate hydratase [Paenibacillus sp. RU4X]SIR72111.1 aconitate hydratase [Paenibacillus sp. RU4T]